MTKSWVRRPWGREGNRFGTASARRMASADLPQRMQEYARKARARLVSQTAGRAPGQVKVSAVSASVGESPGTLHCWETRRVCAGLGAGAHGDAARARASNVGSTSSPLAKSHRNASKPPKTATAQRQVCGTCTSPPTPLYARAAPRSASACWLRSAPHPSPSRPSTTTSIWPPASKACGARTTPRAQLTTVLHLCHDRLPRLVPRSGGHDLLEIPYDNPRSGGGRTKHSTATAQRPAGGQLAQVCRRAVWRPRAKEHGPRRPVTTAPGQRSQLCLTHCPLATSRWRCRLPYCKKYSQRRARRVGEKKAGQNPGGILCNCRRSAPPTDASSPCSTQLAVSPRSSLCIGVFVSMASNGVVRRGTCLNTFSA